MRSVGKIIIVEGVDCTGKSTFVRHLYEALDHRSALMHAGPPDATNAYDEYVRPLIFARQNWTVICDRWHLGEWVWPAIFGRLPLYIDDKDLLGVEEGIRQIGAEVRCLYFERPVKEVVQELQRRDQPSVYIEKAFELYEDAIRHSSFEWEKMSLPQALGMI